MKMRVGSAGEEDGGGREDKGGSVWIQEAGEAVHFD